MSTIDIVVLSIFAATCLYFTMRRNNVWHIVREVQLVSPPNALPPLYRVVITRKQHAWWPPSPDTSTTFEIFTNYGMVVRDANGRRLSLEAETDLGALFKAWQAKAEIAAMVRTVIDPRSNDMSPEEAKAWAKDFSERQRQDLNK